MKKIKTFSINMITNETDEAGFKQYYEERDEAGNVILDEKYHADGTLNARSERTFDKENRILEEKFYSEEGTPDSQHTYQYNSSGKLELVTSKYKDGTIGYKRISYDEANRAETVLIQDENNITETKEYRRYDMEDRVLEEIIYEPEDSLKQKTITSYDDHGRIISKNILYDDGYQGSNQYEYEFDEQGRVISLKIENERQEEIHYEEYLFDDANNMIEYYTEAKPTGQIFIRKLAYDEKARLIKEQILNGAELLQQETTYIYNDEGILLEKEVGTASGFIVEQYNYEYY